LIDGLDHLVMTIRDEDATRRFYENGLGMRWVTFGSRRHALAFGAQKINIHYAGREFEPKAAVPTPGSQDLCFLTEIDLGEIAQKMAALGFAVIEGPVDRTGARGPLLSIYFRDPDGNLIEISNLQPN
jgi:catechol 2,3-dioxygenase-like lactoylglutathione lyase family enzyme